MSRAQDTDPSARTAHTSVLAPNSRFFSTAEWPTHYRGFCFILLKARKQIRVPLDG